MKYNALLSSASKVARTLRAMSNDHRLKILCHLSEGERTVTQLCDVIGISQSALSQHLAKLRQDGLVKTRRQAQNIHYSLAKADINEILTALQDGLRSKRSRSRAGNGRVASSSR